jgi:hypothetical protein
MSAIALALTRLATIAEAFYEKLYPTREYRDATVTHRPSEEEALREAQGQSDESDSEWIGQRERRTQEAERPKG